MRSASADPKLARLPDAFLDESKQRRRPRPSSSKVLVLQAVALLLVVGAIFWLMSQANVERREAAAEVDLDSEKRFDCVIVPGGGLVATGRPHPWVAARLDAALKHDADTSYYLVLSRGTTHKPPPLDEAGFPVDESMASARYLIERGVAPARVLLESWSLDTIGNAAFARLMHSDVRGWRRILIVTSRSHMPRTRAIFEWVFSLGPGPAALSRRPGRSSSGGGGTMASAAQIRRERQQRAAGTAAGLLIDPPELEFEEVSEGEHLDAEQLAERTQKEHAALTKLRATTETITDLAMLHEFLFARHDAYKALTAEDTARRDRERAPAGSALAGTY
jgi:uncharacterized SAM-binding protein YcdF (DUF218 family)